MSHIKICILCGGGHEPLSKIGQKGLRTLLDHSLPTGDDLQSRVKLGNICHIHETCRRNHFRTKCSAERSAIDKYTKTDDGVTEHQLKSISNELQVSIKTTTVDDTCVICGEGRGFLTRLGAKGLATLKTLNQNARLFVHDRAAYHVHETCRRNYYRGTSPAVTETEQAGALWRLEINEPASNHDQYLSKLAKANGFELVNTIGGGNCFFDAVRHGLTQLGIERMVSELRFAAAIELQLNAPDYSPMYTVENVEEQAATFEQFVNSTLNGNEWATQLTVAAMAKALNMTIRLISTATGKNGRITAWQQDFADGVTQQNKVIFVGYNRQTAHYVAFKTHLAATAPAEKNEKWRNANNAVIPLDLEKQVNDHPELVCCSGSADESMFSDINPVNIPVVKSTLPLGTHLVAPSTAGNNENNRNTNNTEPGLTMQVNLLTEHVSCSGSTDDPMYTKVDPNNSPMDTSIVEDCCTPMTGTMNQFHDPIGTQSAQLKCANCLRCEAGNTRLDFRTCSGPHVKRKVRLLNVRTSKTPVVLCYNCKCYLQPNDHSAKCDLWTHGWPCALAILLVRPKYKHVRADLWKLLPMTLRLTWKQLALELSLDIMETELFTDVTTHLSRYNSLTTSGSISDFITSMTDYSFPTIKCPAGCFSYVDECQTLPFKHFIAWKFGVRLFNADSQQLRGARRDWPSVSVHLNTFTVYPSVVVTDDGLMLLLCKQHDKRLTKSIIHVPRNPVLGDMGFQFPDTTAAAILTPNVVRHGRMGKWTNSSHVINAIGGYTGISSSSIVPKIDLPIHDIRLASAEFLSATNRTDVYNTLRERYDTRLPDNENKWEEHLTAYNKYLKPNDADCIDCLAGATHVNAHDAFAIHDRLLSRDTRGQLNNESNQMTSKSLTQRVFATVHPCDEYGSTHIVTASVSHPDNRPIVANTVRILLHCPPINAVLLDSFISAGNAYLGRLTAFVKMSAIKYSGVPKNQAFRDWKNAEVETTKELKRLGIAYRSTAEAVARLIAALAPNAIIALSVDSTTDWKSLDWSRDVIVLWTQQTRRSSNSHQTALPINYGEHCLLAASGGNNPSLPVHYFRWHPHAKFWKSTYGSEISSEKTQFGPDSGSITNFRQWRLLLFMRVGSITGMNDSLTKSLRGQDIMWCNLHSQYLVKQGRNCTVACCIKNCSRAARWLCLGKGEFCRTAVCHAHAKDLLQRHDRVDIECNMEGRRLAGQKRQQTTTSPTSYSDEPYPDEDVTNDDEDNMSTDDEDNTEIFAPIGIEDPADDCDNSPLHSRKDIIPIYDINSSGIPGHYIWNKGYNVLRRRMHHYPNAASNSMMQHIISMTNEACASLLYPEGQLFPRIFWNARNSSVLGAIPSFMLNCMDESTNYGIASLKQHHAIRIRDGDILTAKENGYWHYMFDVMLNAQLNHTSSKLVFKRGLEFLLETGNDKRASSYQTPETKLPMDEAESTRRVKELASLLKKGKWTYFITLTVNDAETPGVREITRAIRTFADGDEHKMQELVTAYLPFTLRCWERFVRVLLQELILRNDTIIGKVKDMFYRFEFQESGAKGNKPHVHAGITLETEPDEISVSRICCSSLHFSSESFGTDLTTLLKLGVVANEADYNTWLEIVHSVQTHDCARTGGRCQKATNAQGDKICRYHRQPRCPISGTSGWFQSMEPPYSEEVFLLLNELGLAKRQPVDSSMEGNRDIWYLHESLAVGKWHYFARSDEFFLASIPLLSAITRSATNVDKCDRHFQVSYLIKYIAGKEEHQLVDVAGSKNIAEVAVRTEDHAHEKISSNAKIILTKEKLKPHFGREISLAEIVWFILGFPYTHCTSDFVHVPTQPLDSRAAVMCTRQKFSTAVDARKDAGLPQWRLFTTAQEAHIEEYMKSCVSIDRTSAFNIRPPELMVFDSLLLYNECFVSSKLKSHPKLTALITDDAWVDGAGRQVRLWSCSIDKCVAYLEKKSASGCTVIRQLIDKIFLPIQRGCPILLQRFVKYTTATQIVSVVSFVKPWDRSKFLTHLCLSQGRYTTELDAFGSGGMKEAFYNMGLTASPEQFTASDMRNILRTYILTDLAFHPITTRKFGRYLMTAKDTLNDLVTNTISNYTPCVMEIMLQDQANQQLLENESARKKCLVQGLIDDSHIANNIPAGLADATKDFPLYWVPRIEPFFGLSYAAIQEQSQALNLCTEAVDIYINPACRGVKFPCLVGRPGSGKSHVLKLACAYALSKGLNVELMSLTSERARKLGGSHMHLVFPMSVNKSVAVLSNQIAYDCLKKLEHYPMKKLLIKRTDVYVFEEIGMMSAQVFHALDLVLQMIMGNTSPWGGKLLMCSGDAKQLPPITGQPLWSSIHMCTVMNVAMFTKDVRARDDTLRWLNDQCRRQQTAHEAAEIADVVLSQCTFVDDWMHVPDDAIRIVSTRAAERDVMEEFLLGKQTIEYCAIDEVQNNTAWVTADKIISKQLNKTCYEYEKCRLFVGAVVRMTYNERHGSVLFSQGQVGIVSCLVDQSQPFAQQTLTIRLAPPGVRMINATHIPDQWPEVTVRRRTTPAVPTGRGLQMGRRTQFPVRYHLASTIHRIQGDTVPLYATQISETQKKYRLWQKEQFAVLISRAEHCKDIIFVGSKVETKNAIIKILQTSSKWDMLIDNVLSSLDVLSSPPVREINQQLHPFKPLYRELPAEVCGYVYILVSIPKPKKCYIGETKNLKQCLRQHNTGYGDVQTKPTSLHPWGVYAFVCGFEATNDQHNNQRRQDFFKGIQYFDITQGPEYAYSLMKDQVCQWNDMGFKSLILVKCGELIT